MSWSITWVSWREWMVESRSVVRENDLPLILSLVTLMVLSGENRSYHSERTHFSGECCQVGAQRGLWWVTISRLHASLRTRTDPDCSQRNDNIPLQVPKQSWCQEAQIIAWSSGRMWTGRCVLYRITLIHFSDTKSYGEIKLMLSDIII